MTEPKTPYTLPLAHGDLSEKDAAELRQLKDQIKRDIGFMCEGYKEHCLRRRIAVRMRARGLHTYGEYADLLNRDEAEHRKFLDAVTINVSKFFRNRELWRVMERDVVPQLFELRARPVRILSAGCAAGEEPYTIAMMLREYALRVGKESALRRFEITGIDIDRVCLNHARNAQYTAFAFTDIDEAVRKHWFLEPDFVEVLPEIKKTVRFEEKDLIKDELNGPYHLIMCRNVIIYFERVIQEELFMRFYDALAPGGFLVLGKVETIFGRAASVFKPVSQRERVFVKP
jgi:chemotaxis protein methyltransferase CheR